MCLLKLQEKDFSKNTNSTLWSFSHIIPLLRPAVPNLFLLAYRQAENRKLSYPLVNFEKAYYNIFISVKLKMMIIWRTLEISHVPLGYVRKSGWKPLTKTNEWKDGTTPGSRL